MSLEQQKEEALLKRISELELEIKKIKKQKKYGLVWEEKIEQIVEDCKRNVPILKLKEKSKSINPIIINNQELDDNILIEGDNYHALSVLNYTHKGKIDVIYIDPPYNTGARDWKYNNDYVDDNDAYRHSKWLSMMENRLKLARGLLKDTGILICTIDKNEQARLAMLLEKIFLGYEMVCVTIIHNPAGTQGNNFSYTNEYAFFVFPNNGIYINKTNRNNTLISSFRDWGTVSLREQAKTCFYPIIVRDNIVVGFGDVSEDDFHPQGANIKQQDGSIYVYPVDNKGVEKKWVFGRNTVEEIKQELFCKIVNGEINIFRSKNETSYKTVWDDTKFYANIYGSKLLNNIINSDFPFPKSLYAVMECIGATVHDKKDAKILDFFAGSGTTGHAVLELNKLDGGNRKFILSTNSEVGEKKEKEFKDKYKLDDQTFLKWKNDNKKEWLDWCDLYGIASSVTYERLKRVMNGYKNKKGEKVEGLGGNLRYYKTDLVDIEKLHYTPDNAKIKLTYQAGEMIALRENTLNEVEKNEWWQIFEGLRRNTAIYFKEDKEKLQLLVDKLEKTKKPCALYIFSWGKNEYKSEYSSKNIRVEDIPEPILEVYKEINRL